MTEHDTARALASVAWLVAKTAANAAHAGRCSKPDLYEKLSRTAKCTAQAMEAMEQLKKEAKEARAWVRKAEKSGDQGAADKAREHAYQVRNLCGRIQGLHGDVLRRRGFHTIHG